MKPLIYALVLVGIAGVARADRLSDIENKLDDIEVQLEEQRFEAQEAHEEHMFERQQAHEEHMFERQQAHEELMDAFGRRAPQRAPFAPFVPAPGAKPFEVDFGGRR